MLRRATSGSVGRQRARPGHPPAPALDPAPVGAVPRSRQTPTAPRPPRRPLLLRRSAPPYLLAADVAAFAASRVMAGRVEPVDAALVVLLVLCCCLSGLYRSRMSLSLLDDSAHLLLAVTAVGVAQVALSGLLPGRAPLATSLLQAVLLLGLLLAGRGAAQATVHWARRTGRVRHNTLVVGAGTLGIRIGRVLREHPEYGLDLVGFIDASPRVGDGEVVPAPVLGGYGQLAAQIHRQAARVVIVAFGAMREADLVEVLRTCDRLQCEILVVPRLYEVHPASRSTELLRGIPLVRVRRAPFRRPVWRLKRAFDVAFAGAALLALSPLLLAVAAAVRCEGGRGVIFRQVRVGLDGREFQVLKFRSLTPTSDVESASRWSVAHDARLGPVGRFLRQTSLDELPQLWNILRGDMSVVGPRPERPHYVEEFSHLIPRYTARHRVPSGLTGWAQVNGLRGDTSIEDRAVFDNYYVENWSLWLDLKIILRTTTQVLSRQGS